MVIRELKWNVLGFVLFTSLRNHNLCYSFLHFIYNKRCCWVLWHPVREAAWLHDLSVNFIPRHKRSSEHSSRLSPYRQRLFYIWLAEESQVDRKTCLTILFDHCPVVFDKNVKLATQSNEQLQLFSSHDVCTGQMVFWGKGIFVMQDGGCVEVVVGHLARIPWLFLCLLETRK